jgi:hypothetical protein
MSNEKIQQLLQSLQKEIQQTEISSETSSLMRELDSDIHNLLDESSPENDSKAVLERARVLEANFATSHPTAERFLREVINALGRMGI